MRYAVMGGPQQASVIAIDYRLSRSEDRAAVGFAAWQLGREAARRLGINLTPDEVLFLETLDRSPSERIVEGVRISMRRSIGDKFRVEFDSPYAEGAC